MPETLASVLGEWIKANGLTWGSLAKRMRHEGAGVSHATLYAIRDGSTPVVSTVRALARVTGYPFEYLLDLAVKTTEGETATDPRLAKLAGALRSLPEDQRDAWVSMCVGGARSIAREAKDA